MIIIAIMIEWQKKTKTRKEVWETVSDKWYRNFLNRHPNIADTFVVKFGTKHSEWVTLESFSMMYDMTYVSLVEAHVAVEDYQEKFFDGDGKEVEEYDDK